MAMVNMSTRTTSLAYALHAYDAYVTRHIPHGTLRPNNKNVCFSHASHCPYTMVMTISLLRKQKNAVVSLRRKYHCSSDPGKISYIDL